MKNIRQIIEDKLIEYSLNAIIFRNNHSFNKNGVKKTEGGYHQLHLGRLSSTNDVPRDMNNKNVLQSLSQLRILTMNKSERTDSNVSIKFTIQI